MSKNSMEPTSLKARADKEANRFTLFGKSERDSNAADLYEQAGNAFKAEQDLEQAIECYKSCVAKLEGLREDTQKVSVEQKLADCYMKQQLLDYAEELYESSIIPKLKREGKSGNVGKIYEKMAEARFQDGDKDKAITHLQRASQAYEAEDSASGKRRAKSRLAELTAQRGVEKTPVDVEQLLNSQREFVDCGEICLQEQILRFNAKKYFVYAVYCALASGDHIGADDLVKEFHEKDPNFADSREENHCEDLVKACKNGSVEDFVETLNEQDKLSKLDALSTKLLLAAKRSITDQDAPDGEFEYETDLM